MPSVLSTPLDFQEPHLIDAVPQTSGLISVISTVMDRINSAFTTTALPDMPADPFQPQANPIVRSLRRVTDFIRNIPELILTTSVNITSSFCDYVCRYIRLITPHVGSIFSELVNFMCQIARTICGQFVSNFYGTMGAQMAAFLAITIVLIVPLMLQQVLGNGWTLVVSILLRGLAVVLAGRTELPFRDQFHTLTGLWLYISSFRAVASAVCKSTAVIPQSLETSDFMKVLSFLACVTCLCMGLKMPKTNEEVTRLMMKFSTIGRVISSWDALSVRGAECYDVMLRYIMKYWYGDTEYNSVYYVHEVEQLACEVSDLLTLENQHKIGRDLDICDRIEAAYLRYIDLARKFAANREISMKLRSFAAALQSLYDGVVAKNPNALCMRQEPLCMVFSGEPGVGKSYLMQVLQQDLLKIAGKYEPNGKIQNNIYSRCQEHEFWDGYRGQTIVIVDDFGQQRDSITKPNLDFFELIRAVNIFPLQLHSASLLEKANNAYTSEFVCLTTNLQIDNNPALAPSLIEPTAVKRRLHMRIKVDVKPEVKSAINGIETLDVEKLNEYRLDNNLDDGDTSHWIFTLNGDEITYDDLVVAISLAYKKKCDDFETRKSFAARSVAKKLPTGAFSRSALWVEPQNSSVMKKACSFATFMSKTFTERYEWLKENCVIRGDSSEIVEVEENDNRIIRCLKKMAYYADPWAHLLKCKERLVKMNLPANCMIAIYGVWDFTKSLSQYFPKCYNLKHIGIGLSALFGGIAAIWILFKKLTSPNTSITAEGVSDRERVRFGERNLTIRNRIRVEDASSPSGEFSREDRYKQKNAIRIEDASSPSGEFSREARYKKKPVVRVEENDEFKMVTPNIEKVVPKDMTDPMTRLKMSLDMIRPEGVLSKPADDLANMVMKNYWMVDIVADGVSHFIGQSLCLKGHKALMNIHYVWRIDEYVSSSKDCYLQIRAPRSLEGHQLPLDKFIGSVRRVYRGQLDTDFVIFDLPNSCALGQDLTKHMAEAADIDKLSSGLRCILPTFTSEIPSFREGDFVTRDTRELWVKQTQSYRTFHASLVYNIATKPGDCGAPLIINSNMFIRKIVGFHYGGTEGKGVANVVCVDDVREALRREPVSPQNWMIKDPEPSDYESFPLKDGNFKLLGKLDEPVFQPLKTSIVPSTCHGVFPVLSQPAILEHPLKEDGVMLKGINKLASSVVDLDQACIDFAVSDYTRLLKKLPIQEDERRVLSFEEACAGITGNKYFPPLKRGKSAGWPFAKMTNMRGKMKWLGTDEWDFSSKESKELRSIVTAMEKQCINNVEPEVYFIDTLKDEKRSLEKIRDRKTRVFSAAPLHFSILYRKYFLGFIAYTMRNKIDNEVAVGTNVWSTDWNKIADHIKTFPHVVAGDFANFDGTVQFPLFSRIVDIVNAFYSDSARNQQVRKIIWGIICRSKHILHDFVYAVSHGQPSGNPGTAPKNSIYVSLALRYIWYSVFRNDHEKKHAFQYYVKPITYGDDFILSVSSAVKDIFTPRRIAQGFAELNMKITAEDKTELTDEFRTLEDVTFLKRAFVKDPKYEHWYAPLSISSITEMCNWIRRTDNPEQATLDNLESAIHELTMHDEDTFCKYSSVIQEAANATKGLLIPIDRDYVRRKIALDEWVGKDGDCSFSSSFV